MFGIRAIRYRPRSILRLILVSYLVVLTPPVLAIVFAVGYLEVLFSQGRTAVYDSVRAAQNGRALVEQVTAMERSALHRKLKSLGVVTSAKSGTRVAHVDEDADTVE